MWIFRKHHVSFRVSKILPSTIFIPRSPRKKRQVTALQSRLKKLAQQVPLVKVRRDRWRDVREGRCKLGDWVTGWWQLKHFLEFFTPKNWGNLIPILVIFQMGWNRQPSLGFSNLSCFSLVVGWDQLPHFSLGVLCLVLRPLKPHWMRRTMGFRTCFPKPVDCSHQHMFFWNFGSGFDQDPFFQLNSYFQSQVCLVFGIASCSWWCSTFIFRAAGFGKTTRGHGCGAAPPFEHFGEQFWGVSVRSFSWFFQMLEKVFLNVDWIRGWSVK